MTTGLKMFPLIAIFIFATNTPSISAWDSDQMEVFDLVEEMNNINFYQFLDVPEDANSSAIRHAFRRMSLVLHPDKNDAPDAEARFRELASIHDVLRDPVKRGHYDKVLSEGLPDWHHAVYYYRRARKLGFLEMIVILFSIISVGQYLVAWGSYIENKFTVDELLNSKMKKLRKQRKYRSDTAILPPEFDVNLPKPSLKNTLPCQIPYWLWIFILKSPWLTTAAISFLITKFKERKNNQNKVEIEKPELVVRERVRRRKIPYKIPEINDYTRNNIVGDTHEKVAVEKNETPTIAGGLWTDEDLLELSQMVNKFPPGTSDRWQKVAKAMQRPVPEVAYMANKMKQIGYKVPNSSETVTTEEPKKVKTKATENLESNDSSWTQTQQKTLENALIKYPKGITENRWEKIAKCVSNKTKEECIARYKELNEQVQKKTNSSDEIVENIDN